jgi:hypothetical protein
MDEQRFDNLARGLACGGWSRRGLARVLSGAVLVPLLGWAPEASAKKKKKKKKKKTCKNGAVKCGNACVNTQNNALHCGRCGRSCGINVACVDGECQGGGCPGGQILCGTLCVDPADNEQHCGRCGNACGGDLTCVTGECGCAEGTKCGNKCVDTQNDPHHCNGCNQTCDPSQSCVAGGCTTSACENDEIDCGDGSCIPDGDHPCCNQADCGGSGQSIQGIVCNSNTHRCECELAGWGICQRFDNDAGICGQCCPGAQAGACGGANSDFVCFNETSTGCGCAPPKVNCPGTSQKCSDNLNTDSRRCGPNCEDCTLTNKTCCGGECVYLGGCQPGDSSGCFNARCGSCDNRCGGDTPLCCDQDGPSGVCVLASFCPFPPF